MIWNSLLVRQRLFTHTWLKQPFRGCHSTFACSVLRYSHELLLRSVRKSHVPYWEGGNNNLQFLPGLMGRGPCWWLEVPRAPPLVTECCLMLSPLYILWEIHANSDVRVDWLLSSLINLSGFSERVRYGLRAACKLALSMALGIHWSQDLGMFLLRHVATGRNLCQGVALLASSGETGRFAKSLDA